MILRVISDIESSSLTERYDNVLRNFSTNNKVSKVIQTIETDIYIFSIIDIDTLDILPELYIEFCKINDYLEGFFLYYENGVLCMEIKNGL